MGVGRVVGAEQEASRVPRDDGGTQRSDAELTFQTENNKW